MRTLALVLALGLAAPSIVSAQAAARGWGRVSFVSSDPAVTFHVPGASSWGSAWSGRAVVAWRDRTYRPI